MPRLPLPGSDDGTWGDVLNDYLVQAHNADGTLKANVVSNTNIVDGTIQAAKLAQTYIQSSEKGSANGIASLDATTKIPVGQLPVMGGDLSGTVSSAQIVAGVVGTTELTDSSVTIAKLAAAIADSLVPSGAITPFAGAGAPTGWFACDGTAVSRATYGALFTAIGTTYGAGDGSTTFNLPNLRGRVPVGVDGTQTEFDARGETGGAKTHTLSAAEMPSHTHIQNSHNHTQNSHNHTQNAHTHLQQGHNHGNATGSVNQNHYHSANTGVGSTAFVTSGGGDLGSANISTGGGGYALSSTTNWQSHDHLHQIPWDTAVNWSETATNIATTATNIAATATNQNTGGGAAHNILQPYIALNYIIKY